MRLQPASNFQMLVRGIVVVNQLQIRWAIVFERDRRRRPSSNERTRCNVLRRCEQLCHPPGSTPSESEHRRLLPR